MNDHAFAGAEHATPVSEPYWHGLAEGRLVLQRCNACGRHQHYPRHICRWCGSTDLDWTEAAGTGSIVARTTVHRTSRPDGGLDLPYDLVIVRVEEGPLLMALLAGEGPDAPAADDGTTGAGRLVAADFARTSAAGLLTFRVV
jgi:hypothetical protein